MEGWLDFGRYCIVEKHVYDVSVRKLLKLYNGYYLDLSCIKHIITIMSQMREAALATTSSELYLPVEYSLQIFATSYFFIILLIYMLIHTVFL